MKVLTLFIFTALLAGCSSNNEGFNRGYVISKSHVDNEVETISIGEEEHLKPEPAE